MKQIALSGKRGKGKFAIVDDEDYELISAYRWQLSSNGYARTSKWVNKKNVQIWMHRIINKTAEESFTDHINGDKLDNRRVNLRTCNHSQNMANSKKKESILSKYRGIRYRKCIKNKTGKTYFYWTARLKIDGKIKSRNAKTEIEAAQAYNELALKHHGEFAKLNDIPSLITEAQ